MGKKTPFTLDKFVEFFRLLPERGDSDRSWTVDLVERKRKAAEQSDPLKRQAKVKEQEAKQGKERLAELKNTIPVDEAAVTEVEARVTQLITETRELAGRAQAIDEAVYDLKAVNPNAKKDEDTRTPEELLDLIEAKGREVREALALLRGDRASPEVVLPLQNHRPHDGNKHEDQTEAGNPEGNGENLQSGQGPGSQ